MPGAASVLELYYLIGASFSMPRFCLVAIQSSRAQASGSRTFSTPLLLGSTSPGSKFTMFLLHFGNFSWHLYYQPANRALGWGAGFFANVFKLGDFFQVRKYGAAVVAPVTQLLFTCAGA